MKDKVFSVRSVRWLTRDVGEIWLGGDVSGLERPGQFVEVGVPGYFLRRPISVADWGEGKLLLLVRAVGGGTRALLSAGEGAEFPVLLPLGNGFDVEASRGHRVVLVGGGIGIAPLVGLGRRMVAAGLEPEVVLGFRDGGDVFYVEEFRSMGVRVHVATEDGSVGTKGFVTDAIREGGVGGEYVYACGPMPMLRALSGMSQWVGGQYSFEARMGCGFGVCAGCTIQTVGGAKRVCKEGPIFTQEQIQW